MADLAKRVEPETTASTINKLEKSKLKLTQGWMMRLAEALGIEQKDLLDQRSGVEAGFFDNVKPFIPGPKDALRPTEGTVFFMATNNDLDEHPERIIPGRIIQFKLVAADLKDIQPGQVCLFDLYDKSAKPKAVGHVIGQFTQPNKLASNSSTANWIIRVNDEHLLYLPRLRGVMIHVISRPNA